MSSAMDCEQMDDLPCNDVKSEIAMAPQEQTNRVVEPIVELEQISLVFSEPISEVLAEENSSRKEQISAVDEHTSSRNMEEGSEEGDMKSAVDSHSNSTYGDKEQGSEQQPVIPMDDSINGGDVDQAKMLVDTDVPAPENPSVENDGSLNCTASSDDSIEKSAYGVEYDKMPVSDDFLNKIPDMQWRKDHTIMIDVETVKAPFSMPPEPYPDRTSESEDVVAKYRKFHSDAFASLPLSFGSGWNDIIQALGTDFNSMEDIENAIHVVNYGMNVANLRYYVEKQVDDKDKFFNMIRKMADLAAELPLVCTHAIPLLKKQCDRSITMSQKQVACLLANAFFCLFPKPQQHNFAYLTFRELFADSSSSRLSVQIEKLKCLFEYFTKVTANMPTGNVTFHRQVVAGKEAVNWSKSNVPVNKLLRVSVDDTMPDCGRGMLYVDFANKYVGGGMLGHGCVQEEILFMLYPELIVSRLFTEELDDNETLIYTGCERFSESEGYASSFTWTRGHHDNSKRDKWGRRQFEIVAMDALVLWNHNLSSQLRTKYVSRELNKAYCGFRSNDLQQCQSPTTVVTGNWGCGAFGGNPYLKSLLQLMAASQAGRPMLYLTFGDRELAFQLHNLHRRLTDAGCTVGQLWRYLKDASKYDMTDGWQLFEHITRCVNNEKIEQCVRIEDGSLSAGDALPAAEGKIFELPPLKPSAVHAVMVDFETVREPFDVPALPLTTCAPDTERVCAIAFLPYIDDAYWLTVTNALRTQFDSSADVENAIHSYNKTRDQVKFTGLTRYLDERQRRSYNGRPPVYTLVNKIAELALELPNICPQPIPLLDKQRDFSITLSQKQIACLIANAFFCTYHVLNDNCGSVNLDGLYGQCGKSFANMQSAKLDCIFNYFERIAEKMPAGNVTFHRQVRTSVDWPNSVCTMNNELKTFVRGRMENDAAGCLQVDFANKYLGAGSVFVSCTQEEILFMLYPELIASILFTVELDINEALIVTGCERFNDSTGYLDSFRWTANFVDETQRDAWGRRACEIVAIDAMVLWSYPVSRQLSEEVLVRELDKAFCGFDGCNFHRFKPPAPVATGNWGCGAFGGNSYIKAVIQLMAASQAGRPVWYFTYGDKELAESLTKLHETIVKAGCTVGRMWQILRDAASSHHVVDGVMLYDFIISRCSQTAERRSCCMH